MDESVGSEVENLDRPVVAFVDNAAGMMIRYGSISSG
jgi:hypothetical protein